MDLSFIPSANTFISTVLELLLRNLCSNRVYKRVCSHWGDDNYIRNHLSLLFINYPCDISPLWDMTIIPAVDITTKYGYISELNIGIFTFEHVIGFLERVSVACRFQFKPLYRYVPS